MSYALQRDESPKKGLRRVAAETLDGALAEIAAGLRDEGDPHHAVHEARKACKKVRALLRMYRPGLGDLYKAENAAARDAANGLSAWRDHHVLPQTSRRIAEDLGVSAERPVGGAAPDRPVEEALRDAADRLQDLRGRVEGWRVKRARSSVAAGVADDYRKGRKRLRRCSRDAPAEAWHDWRKAVKRHAYHQRLLRMRKPTAPAASGPWDRLAELLGDEHDLSVLLARLGDDAGALAAAAAERRRGLRDEAKTLGQTLYRRPAWIVRSFTRLLVR